MQFYLNPKRERDERSLPDAEVFHSSDAAAYQDGEAERMDDDSENVNMATNPGYYWWPCFPGCLPDGDPIGPFDTEALAVADAQGGASAWEEPNPFADIDRSPTDQGGASA